MVTETWVHIKGVKPIYQISTLGRVKTFHPRYRTPRILKPGLATMGYLTVSLLMNDESNRSHYIHRLLADAFIPNPDNKKSVNHKDGNKLNNSLYNLEWCTQGENNYHAIEYGLRSVKMTDCIISEILSTHIKADKTFGAKALAKKYNVNKSTIHQILNQYKYAITGSNERESKAKAESLRPGRIG